MTNHQRLEHHSIFEYLYRDAGNFKTYGALLLTGYTPDADANLRACLEWGDQFVAEQVGVPVLCPEHWESVGVPTGLSDLDHAIHELFVCATGDLAGTRPAARRFTLRASFGTLGSALPLGS